MPDCVLKDLTRGTRIPFSVNGKNPTFRLRTERIAAKAMRNLSPHAEDLLDVAAAVFYADGKVSRGGASRSDMGSAWHRRLHLTIPVRDPALWQRPEVTGALRSALHLLTGDQFEFDFTANHSQDTGSGFLDFDPAEVTFAADDVIMFSGGLDSYAGALETLSTGKGRVLLVSHQSAPKVVERQRKLAKYLIDRFPGRAMHISIPANRSGEESTDTTQRSRSFLFTAIGAVVASAFDARKLNFFENGIVSHNLPVSPQIVGSMASRTTHPLGLRRLQELIDLVLPDAPRIANVYEWMTKSEVLDRIARASGEKNIGIAVSCTRVRDQTKIHTHCGSCSQCLDRRFAVIASGLEAFDPPESYATDVLFGPRDETGAATLPVFWTQHFTNLHSKTLLNFVSSFGVELYRLVEAYPGISREDCIQKIFDLHQRQSKIVQTVLENQIKTFASDLVKGDLPGTSLLVMHVGKGKASEDFAPATQSARVPSTATDAEQADDNTLNPDGPLELLFSLQNGKPYVVIRGLCDLNGSVARLTHMLKVPFEEDKRAGKAPEDHRYVHIAKLPGAEISKGNVRVILSRGKRELSEAYRMIFDRDPPPDILFQSRKRKGHRLNPSTEVRDSH